ncbi:MULTISPECIES: hypothetical protein [Micromonospora]|uniref:Uncharacterized protein n=1 Tax=Micromonospora zamorensis TaxID=709883 RepID=A0ABZ1PBN6_9ACTN|nr:MULTISPECIES: hypothetical protein [Micromonospora]MBQ0978586.1 hypothetical protein [Micromonospora sp. M61]MBQ1036188.1 hypothetical protein [Micromonospora sp. C81]WSK45923.1 hypothetical protein OG423_17800 [Micromonospora zamorensis]WTI20196.1 hypothetical protein OG886_25105 [Micromonospora zamorensis]
MFGMRKAWERELGAAVDELVAADTLAFGGVGIAGKLLPVTEAYQRVEAAIDDHPEEVRRQLDRVLADGTPAGRAYAATLLERIDPAAARAAWTSLRDDPSEFTTFVGCVMDRETIGNYATQRLAAA